ncbi:MAG: U32 family peptidase [Clostridia bacterium]|nr:U32 family peptidase [Clostridia bacterium]
MKKPELLAPAGSFEKAKTAFLYGADAIYAGTSSLSLRTRAEMQDDDLVNTIKYAHEHGKKVYTTINIFAWDDRYEEIKEQAKILNELKVDGIIVADGGVVEIIKEYAPDVDIHISTQANTVSYHSSKFWYNNGAKRVILARELSKNQIKEIVENKPKDLETEMFIHGAICFSYSGRCFLSDFLSNRSANLGDCAQSCRWAYNVYVEETNNPGKLMPVEADEKGTYIFSSRDLCLIKEIPEIVNLGVDSLKIEGRLKTEYYLATVINAYRNAIDDYMANPESYDYTKYLSEIEKTKTRGLTTFYFNYRDNKDIQDYSGNQYNANYEFGAKIIEKENEKYIVEIKNRLQVGDTLEIIVPNKIIPIEFKLEELWDIETDDKIDYINPGKVNQKVKMKLPIEAETGYVIRRKKS